jgi:hypothetical protein
MTTIVFNIHIPFWILDCGIFLFFFAFHFILNVLVVIMKATFVFSCYGSLRSEVRVVMSATISAWG